MNIPDNIRVVARGAQVAVFSADNDTADIQSGDILPTASVVLYFDPANNLTVAVTFGRSYSERTIATTYDAAHVTLDIQHAP